MVEADALDKLEVDIGLVMRVKHVLCLKIGRDGVLLVIMYILVLNWIVLIEEPIVSGIWNELRGFLVIELTIIVLILLDLT